MKDTIAIILAAGKGTRMKSEVPKILHEILGKPIIYHILECLKDAGVKEIITVAGYGCDLLKKALPINVKIVLQKKLLGSGDAVMATRNILKRYSGDILIICGDTPIIKGETLTRLIKEHKSSGASATVLTARIKDPGPYGRIVRGEGGEILKIAEETEARLYEKVINEINVGTYCFTKEDLFTALKEVKPNNKKKEFFLTDTIGILYNKGKMIESVLAEDPEEIVGINTRIDLAQATRILKERILEDVMSGGVTIEDTSSTTIYPGVKIGPDTIIHPNTLIESDVEIGRNCHIGPFAHLRPGVRIGDNVEVGNFVELVRTNVKNGTKVKHHTYLGDAIVGKGVNVGAGTITANFDGKNKNRTVIGDGAFIGVGAILIAPVKIGARAIVGAGCVVPKNHDVPNGATVVGVPAKVLQKRKKRG